jgi:hypothetical protein
MNNINKTQITPISNIDMFLDKECKLNKCEPWNKLDKTEKIKQLNDFVDSLIKEYILTDEEIKDIKNYLISCLDKKKLQCVKDVQYDKTCGKIKSIPCFHYNTTTRKFTLKRCEKRVSTLKSLGKGNASKKNKEKETDKL